MRIRAKLGLAAASAAICISATASAQQTPAAQPTTMTALKGNAESGKKLFVDRGCYTCHGYAAHGGAGARLAGTPPAVPAFIRYVRHPTGQMPPFGERMITDQDLADIQAYVTTLPRPVDAKTIPILQDADK